MRWRLVLEYDGNGFYGFQRQKEFTTVQGVLERAILDLFGDIVNLTCAGRTDRGVHALGQVVHIDIPSCKMTDYKMRSRLNDYLRVKAPLTVLEAGKVGSDFHARFHATQRQYLYRILNRRAPSALNKRRALHIGRKLDFDNMQKACQRFEGTHDFTAFRTQICQAKSPVKTIDMCKIIRPVGEFYSDELHLHVHAQSFLHHQVRNMVGTLLKVGLEQWDYQIVSDIIDSRDRTKSGPTAPPWGLYLVKVTYDETLNKH